MTDGASGKLRIDDFDYELPTDLIAQEPLADRSASRLMVLDRVTGATTHRMFRELPQILRSGDLLVVNDSRVIPARLLGHRETGGHVEVLILRPEGAGLWRALAKPMRRLRVGEPIVVPPRVAGGAEARVTLREKLPDGQVIVEIDDALNEHL